MTSWINHNQLYDLHRLSADFSVMRHGRSFPNEKDLVVSDLESGVLPENGLSPGGRDAMWRSAKEAVADGRVDSRTRIFSSPFSRAKESADILAEVAGVPVVKVDIRLRERYFGELNFGSAKAGYGRVWALDRADPTHSEFGVESVCAVLARTSELFRELDDRARRENGSSQARYLAVFHGDPAQISESGFLKIDPRGHRELPPLEVAQIRPLFLGKN